MLVCDTDAFTTAVFHEVYLGAPATGFDELATRRYDLYLVCGLDVAVARTTADREFEEQRTWMHERLLGRAQGGGAPWLLVQGSPEARLTAATEAVDRLLS